ncbi:MAG: B12-binding domain-containing radical SAM protein [Kiritimatiellia bacterium]
MKERRLVFIQLPHWDNDTQGSRENVRLAASYLCHALERSTEARYWQPIICEEATDELDDRHLTEYLVALRPNVIAATLYLWNVERTLHVLARVKALLPDLVVIVGGPEVAWPHPFLYRSCVPDVAVLGEGEAVFPRVLGCLRTGAFPDLATVGWRIRTRQFRWGRSPAPPVDLQRVLLPPQHWTFRPDRRGMAYLEASRGCPWRCTFCRYPHDRRSMSFVPVHELIRRLRALCKASAREVRFVDPTFNAHPQFEELLSELAKFNQRGTLEFFAELRAETITAKQAALLERAGFSEVEVGVQSRDPFVLSILKRPTDFAALERGLGLLTRHVKRVTVDIMCGLPYQRLDDVQRSLEWAASLKHVRVQLLPALLLPGTELRRRRHAWGLRAADRPPYRVTHTRWMTRSEMTEAEALAREISHVELDVRTCCFVGSRLPDLFRERIALLLEQPCRQRALPGKEIRRALFFRHCDLFGQRFKIARLVARAIRSEPFMLWQFVLCPLHEEPLDVLDILIAEIRRARLHPLDRFGLDGPEQRLVARRIMMLLAPQRSYDHFWVAEAENTLRTAFV